MVGGERTARRGESVGPGSLGVAPSETREEDKRGYTDFWISSGTSTSKRAHFPEPVS